MLYITLPAIEGWDEVKEEFVQYSKEQTLQLEHSLVSLAKWESKWCKPFYSHKDKTVEETIDYIRCMTVTPNVKDDVYLRLTKEHFDQIHAYIEAPMTATTFSKNAPGGKGSNEHITAELIYYWMIAYNIPSDYDKWHLNRLLTLIRVCGVKNQPSKKMSKSDIMSRNAALNAARRKSLGTTG